MKQLFALAILLHTVLPSAAQEKSINRSFTGINTIEAATASGNIVVKKSAGAAVNLTLVHSFDEGDFRPLIEERGGKLTLKEDFARGSHTGNSTWTLEIPDNVTMHLNSGSGNIAIEGVRTNVTSSVGSGNIKLSSVTGELSFNTGSGNIGLTDASGELSFNTGSGKIVAEGGTGQFRLNAGSGNIDLRRLTGTFSINTGSGNIKADAMSFQGAGQFNTGSGDAVVTLASDATHDISVNSGSGDATLDFNGTPMQGEIIMTANEHNGNIVAPFDFDREETIREGNSQPKIRKVARLSDKSITIKVGTGSGTAKVAK